MIRRKGSACGKMILSGEYAVVFGYPGIAVPSAMGIEVAFYENLHKNDLTIVWDDPDANDLWQKYLRTVVGLCEEQTGPFLGTLTIQSTLPLGKGMGSSTALVIAVVRCLLNKSPVAGTRESQLRGFALSIEDTVNPHHSGFDFSIIWYEESMLFRKGTESKRIEIPSSLLRNSILIDTGTPNEQTPELVSWVESRKRELNDALVSIGECTEQLATLCTPNSVAASSNYAAGVREPWLRGIIRKHHLAQVALGVVPKAVRKLIADIENAGGAAKVLGAGARMGGGGIVLAFHDTPSTVECIAHEQGMHTLSHT